MKIASWNVNSIRTRLEHLVTWIQSAKPHVLLLQELKCTENDFPRDVIEDLGYNIAIHGQKSYNGVAILSKFPLEDVSWELPDNPDPSQARYIEALTQGVRVASIYVPNGQEVHSEKYAYKSMFYQALLKHAQTFHHQQETLLWGGDYNVAPYPTDMHDKALSGTERILCSPQEQRDLRLLIHQGRLYDALGDLYPMNPPFTWWDYRQGSFDHNKGFRIDHMLLSSLAMDRLVGAGVDQETRAWERPSDHAPIWVELRDEP